MNKEDRQKKEKSILELIRGGNRLAFNELYELYWKELFGYSYKILCSKDLAQDVVQDVFLKIWINKNDLEVNRLKPYLYNAIRNASISKIREAKFTELHLETIEGLIDSSSSEDNLNYEDLRRNIDRAAEGLPERCKEIFYLSRIRNYSIDEIAEKLNISKRTVENQISTALKHIRPYLRDVAVLAPFLTATVN